MHFVWFQQPQETAFQNGFLSPIPYEVPFESLNKIMSLVSVSPSFALSSEKSNGSAPIGCHFESRLVASDKRCFLQITFPTHTQPHTDQHVLSTCLSCYPLLWLSMKNLLIWIFNGIMFYIKMKENRKHMSTIKSKMAPSGSVVWAGLSASQTCWMLISPRAIRLQGNHPSNLWKVNLQTAKNIGCCPVADCVTDWTKCLLHSRVGAQRSHVKDTHLR